MTETTDEKEWLEVAHCYDLGESASEVARRLGVPRDKVRRIYRERRVQRSQGGVKGHSPAMKLEMPTRSSKLDALNAALKAAETYLYGLDLGAAGRISLDAEAYLVWGKLDGKWGLHIDYVAAEGTPAIVARLLEAPAEDRILAAENLPKLLDAIHTSLDQKLQRIDAAIATATDFAQGAQ